MTLLAEAGAARLFANPAVAPDRAYGAGEAAILDGADFDAAVREIGAWPGYGETPLTALPGLARAAGLGAIHYKDESGRFGLGSFKALGGAYAVLRTLQRAVVKHGRTPPSSGALMAGRHRDITETITVTTAGNSISVRISRLPTNRNPASQSKNSPSHSCSHDSPGTASAGMTVTRNQSPTQSPAKTSKDSRTLNHITRRSLGSPSCDTAFMK